MVVALCVGAAVHNMDGEIHDAIVECAIVAHRNGNHGRCGNQHENTAPRYHVVRDGNRARVRTRVLGNVAPMLDISHAASASPSYSSRPRIRINSVLQSNTSVSYSTRYGDCRTRKPDGTNEVSLVVTRQQSKCPAIDDDCRQATVRGVAERFATFVRINLIREVRPTIATLRIDSHIRMQSPVVRVMIEPGKHARSAPITPDVSSLARKRPKASHRVRGYAKDGSNPKRRSQQTAPLRRL